MDALQRLRKSRGYSQQQIADELGISRQTYSNYELGKREANYETLRRLADYFHVSVDTLLGKPAEPEMPSNAISVAQVPLIPVYGRIAAGAPILAAEEIIGYEPAEGIKNPEEYFYLSVRGDSMINAGIPNGSLVLLHKQDFAENGQIVACLVGGDSVTLKRFKRIDKTVFLMPENSNYEPIIVSVDDFRTGVAKICGVAVEVLQRKRLL
jgi:repressor LexA